jgi:hypothetical protein
MLIQGLLALILGGTAVESVCKRVDHSGNGRLVKKKKKKKKGTLVVILSIVIVGRLT